MAETRKSIIDEAFMEAEHIDNAFKANAKEILAHTMSLEIEEMVKESLGDWSGLTEDEDEENVDLELDNDSDVAGLGAGDDEEFDFDSLDLDDEDDDDDLDGLELGDEDDDDVDVVDLTDEEDIEKVVNVFKKMSPEDEIEVVQDGGNIEIKDNATGAEYRIELGGSDDTEMFDDEDMFDDDDTEMFDDEENEDDEAFNRMGEEVIYEIHLSEDEEGDDDEYMTDEYMTDKDGDMEENVTRNYSNGRKQTLKPDNYPSKFKRPGVRNESVIREVEERNVTPDNVNRYVQGTKISTKHLKAAMDKGEEVKMFSNKEKQTGEGGRHKKVFKVGDNYFKETDTLIYGGKAEAMAYLNESTTPRVTQLMTENKVLKNKVSSIDSENKSLKEDYNKMVDALKEFRNKLNEVAIFNSNLTYTVRLFTEHSTTKDEKVDIIKRFDEAKTLKESKNIYKNLVKEISKTKAPIKESIENKFNDTKSSGSSTQITESKVYVDPQLEKMKKLWEYSYKH